MPRVTVPIMTAARSLGRATGLTALVRRMWPAGIGQNAWLLHQEGVETRVFVSNLIDEPGTEKDPITDVAYHLKLHGPDGRVRAARRGVIRKDETLIVTSKELLDAARVPPPFYGLVEFRFFREMLRTLRPYVQYFTPTTCAVTHGGALTKLTPEQDVLRERYSTFTKLALDDRTRVLIGVYTFDSTPNRTRVILVNHAGETLASAPLTLAPMGSRLFDVERMFPDARAFLGGRLGSLHLDNPLDPISFMWFVHDRQLDVWQANHA